MIYLLMFIVLLVVVGLLQMDGLWGNILNLFNVILAGVVAVNFFEPLAQALDKAVPRGTFLWDFPVLWGLFAISLIIFRVSCDFVSPKKVKFPNLVEMIGNYFVAVWVAWLVMCFTLFSLHTAPLAKNPFFGGFQPESRMFLGLAPDRVWLGFSQQLSEGAFTRGGTPAEGSGVLPHSFDPQSKFMPVYNTRRKSCETTTSLLIE
jgi:hypothetical protein